MLNHQRRLQLPRPTADPTATSSPYFLTLHFLWQGDYFNSFGESASDVLSPGPKPRARPRRLSSGFGEPDLIQNRKQNWQQQQVRLLPRKTM